MSTTTPKALRDSIAARVALLVATSHAGQPFTEHREERPIREWAASNPGSSLRRFSVRWVGSVRGPHVTNTDVELVDQDLEIVVVYPTDGRHGPKMRVDLDTVIGEDTHKINNAVGTNGFAALALATPAATVRSLDGAEDREDLGAAQAGVVRLNASYYRRPS